MKDGKPHELQLLLFETQLVWQLFPHSTREQVNQLLGILCIEIVEKELLLTQEKNNE